MRTLRQVLQALFLAMPAVASAQWPPDGFTVIQLPTGPSPVACQEPLPKDGSDPICIFRMPAAQAAALQAPRQSTAQAATSPPPAASAVTLSAPSSAKAASGSENKVKAQGDEVATAGAAGTSQASAQKKDAFQTIVTESKADLSVPSSPAFSVLGITPDKVDRPGTVRDLVASVARGLGPDGKPVNGLAIDLSPASLFFRRFIAGGDLYAPSKNPHNDLQFDANYWKRVLARTTVSLASTSPDSTGATRTAWSIRTGLVDFGDPGLYYEETVECLRNTPEEILLSGHSLDAKPADNAIQKCNPLTNGKMDKALWAQPSVYAGFGESWFSKSGSLTDHVPDVKAFWLVGSYGIGDASTKANPEALRELLQAYLGRKLNDRTPDPNNASNLLRQDATDVIVRLKIGKENWHGFAEVGRSRVLLGNATTENLRHFALGAEFNIANLLGQASGTKMDSWLQLATVNEHGFSNGKDNNGVTANLKFGVPFLDLP
jgi:hypothetical protein